MNTLRIISGKWRGRKLRFAEANGLRPTTDRVRETLFNWLMPHIQGARCLDLFAGSGMLGFEALSRGAEHVTMLEISRKVIQQLKANRDLLEVDNLSMQQSDALKFIQTYSGEPFDIIFIDPPFHENLIEKSLTALASSSLLAQAPLIYVEQEKKLADPGGLTNSKIIKKQSAGHVNGFLLRQ